MSEFEWLTLITEILMPVRNELALESGESHQQDPPARRRSGDSHGDDGGTGDQEDETEELGVNQVYSVILATAAACNRWLKEDLGPGLRGGGQDFETPMTLDPATDIDHWARERAEPVVEEPAGDDDIERWLHWADLKTARSLPEDTAPREEWSEAVGHGMALVREAIHRLTLARLHMRTGDRDAPENQRRSPDHRERLPRCHLACQHPASLGHSPDPGPQRRPQTGIRPLKALPVPNGNTAVQLLPTPVSPV